ncbi:hypothetical protein [Bdellovibrio sp.]|uniref:hypothetical protein n=1 Tax=Bdellovibrio sp. TaxID=28201 RepID=UPI0039E5B03E
MKYLLVLSLTLMGSLVLAKNQNLKLAGTVPLQGEVHIVFSKSGTLQVVTPKDSSLLRVEIQKRQPASLVRVSAP